MTLTERIAAMPDVEVRKFYELLLQDTCETDTVIRERARGHLSDYEIDGDSWGVPGIEDIVDRLCQKLESAEACKVAQSLGMNYADEFNQSKTS